MSNQETLQKLAEELNTTTEYLWGVLVKQAPIQATIDLIMLIGVVIFGFVLYKVHCYFIKNKQYADKDMDANPITMIPMFILGIIWVVMAIAVFLNIPHLINGFAHPEYWALNEVLDTIN